MRLLFLIGSTDISGGTYVILQHVLEAEARGHDVTIAPLFEPTPDSTRWHPAYDRLRLTTLDEVEQDHFDVAIATWWRTIYELYRISARHYAYFVQSIESRFYDNSEQVRLAEATYDFPVHVITETPWIQRYLAFEHGAPAFLVPNGVEKSLHTPFGPTVARREPGLFRVLVEGPLGVPMKNVEQTIELVAAADPTEIWLMTSSDVKSVEKVDRVFSRIPITSTPSVYRSCDVLVKLSLVEGMFGPPLEMFHCGGTTVCWDVTGYEDYVKHDVNGLVVRTRDKYGTIEAIRYLRDEPFELRRLQNGALTTAARWPSWVESSALFQDVLEVIARQPNRSYEEVIASSARGHADLA